MATPSAAAPAPFVPVTADTVFEPVPLHFKVPHGLFLLEATSVAVDSEDAVYVFNRGNMPVLVFNPAGDLIRYWGNLTPWEGTKENTDPYGNKRMQWRGTDFVRPHSVRVDGSDNVWLVDDCANTVTKCDRYGKRLMMLLPNGVALHDPAAMAAAAGIEHAPAVPAFGGGLFNRPTDVAVAPGGDVFITDGYGNSRVHHFAADGRHIKSWGRPGTDAGALSLPHHAVLHDGLLYVADRENSRVQAFDPADGVVRGAFHAHRAVALTSRGGQLYVAEHGAATRVHRGAGAGDLDSWTPHMGHRICIYDTAHPPALCSVDAPARVATLGAATPGERPGQLHWPHGIAVDSAGAVYAAEVNFCECGVFQAPHAREMVSLRKWVRGAAAAVGARE